MIDKTQTTQAKTTLTPSLHQTELVDLHMVACNGLSAALRLLTEPTTNEAAAFSLALARAMRATTALKRACAELNGGAV